jgi:hypothetical protein
MRYYRAMQHQIVMRGVDTIRPYPENAKKHSSKQIKQVADSIKEFGFNQPVVVDKDGVIIVGHGRFAAAQLLEMTEVPTIVAEDLTEEQAKTYRLADNKLNESPWDMKLVRPELKGLSIPMLDLTGFSRDLIIDASTEDADAIPVLPINPVTKLGDIYELGGHRLMCGDSTDLEQVAKLMDGRRSKMIFTDPPWNVAIGGDNNPRHRQREGLINDDLGKDFHIFLGDVAVSVARFNDGDVYCVMGCEEWPTIHKALTDAGLHWSSTIVWVKDQFVLGRSKYHRRYEPIWYGWKDKSSFVADRSQDDVWEFPRPKRSAEHPTMKPVDLVIEAVKNSSERGDIVLDLFGGGGEHVSSLRENRARLVQHGARPEVLRCDRAALLRAGRDQGNSKERRT